MINILEQKVEVFQIVLILGMKRNMDLLNEQVHALNQLNNVRVPKFTKDLIRTKKCKKRKFETVLYSLLKDILHPKPLLSRYWQRHNIG